MTRDHTMRLARMHRLCAMSEDLHEQMRILCREMTAEVRRKEAIRSPKPARRRVPRKRSWA